MGATNAAANAAPKRIQATRRCGMNHFMLGTGIPVRRLAEPLYSTNSQA